MLDICLLGTGGMMPLPRRWLTSLMTRYNGSNLMIDCGEGTQVAVKEKGWSFKPIDTICFTHYHADHISGLPGMLLTMGNAERTEPLTLIGPKGLNRVVSALRVIAPELPFEIQCIELTESVEHLKSHGYEITAFRVNHNVVCYGYTLEIKRGGKFLPEKAGALGIPLKCWNPLQKGETVTWEGNTYTDLFICEGMYGEKEKEAKAREYKHMTFKEAACLAKEAEVKELWLTHYSPSLVRPEEFMDEVRAIFPRSYPGKDGQSTDLQFEE